MTSHVPRLLPAIWIFTLPALMAEDIHPSSTPGFPHRFWPGYTRFNIHPGIFTSVRYVDNESEQQWSTSMHQSL